MIKDPFLRKVVENSGRREITTDMIVAAEKLRYESLRHTETRLTQFPLELGAPQSGSGSLFDSIFGGIFTGLDGANIRCPYCGKMR